MTARSGTSGVVHHKPKPKRDRVNSNDASTQKPRESKKRKRTLPKIYEENEMLDLETNINTAIGKMDSDLLADYIARSTKRFAGDLSLVELEDRRIPGMTSICLMFRQLCSLVRS